PPELLSARLLIGASVLLVAPLIDAQDPNGTTGQARVLRRLQRAVWQEVVSPAPGSEPWPALLAQLESAFENYVDTSPGGEDFLGMAADQVGSSLELLLAAVPEPTRAWAVLGSIFDALDDYRRQAQETEFFGPWLSALSAELTAMAGNGI